jgi:hypothetical protein
VRALLRHLALFVVQGAVCSVTTLIGERRLDEFLEARAPSS